MCPPGVDQTTRGPQRWHFLAPRVSQALPLAPKNEHRTSSPDEVLFTDNNDWDAWFKFARLPLDNFVEPGVQEYAPAATSQRQSLSFLESMPAEIISIIVKDSGLDPDDIVRLGLASDYLWAHAKIEIARDFSASRAP